MMTSQSWKLEQGQSFTQLDSIEYQQPTIHQLTRHKSFHRSPFSFPKSLPKLYKADLSDDSSAVQVQILTIKCQLASKHFYKKIGVETNSIYWANSLEFKFKNKLLNQFSSSYSWIVNGSPSPKLWPTSI